MLSKQMFSMIRQKIKKVWLLLVFVFCAWSGYAQVPSKPVDAFTLRAGYNHNRDKNTAFLGGGYLVGDYFWASATFYGGVHYLKYDGRHRIVPEIGADFHAVMVMAGLSVTPCSVQPKVGLSLLSIANVTAGYSIPFGREQLFKEVTLGVQIQLPVINRK